MATIFLQPDPVDKRIYPKRGKVLSIDKGILTLRENGKIISIPVTCILRIEWEPGEDVAS